MSIHLVLSLAVTIIGAVVYGIAQGKPSEAGRLAFCVGLLAFLLTFDGSLRLHAG